MARLSDLIREQASSQARGGSKSAPAGSGSVKADHSWIISTRRELHRIREAICSRQMPDFTTCAVQAEQLVPRVLQHGELIGWALSGHTDDYLVDNALHVAVLATKVGVGLNYPEQELERLALAGLLHDIGMWTLPESLLTKAAALSEEERDIIRTHPERGRRILADQGSLFEWVSTICAQEHERWDGGGYPCRLKGKQIAEPAQVIGIVDTVDAMVTRRPYRQSMPSHRVVRELLLHGKTGFSVAVLKALGDHITLYPIGTVVRLSTGETGTVTKTNARHPLRPVITISKFGEASEMDLSQGMSAHIVEVLSDKVASQESSHVPTW